MITVQKIAGITTLTAAFCFTVILATWKSVPADTHVHLAWKILIKNSVMGLGIQVKMKNTLVNI